MTDILQQILQGPPLDATAFPASSRYHGIGTLQLTVAADGAPIVYLGRRFVPMPDRFALLTVHNVREGERLDNITAQYFGDPLQYWRLCDANNVIVPDELTDEVGNEILITLPADIPGGTSA
ncbi:MAG TPA: LysM domain-containing protein [Thermoanaerobaculia bacterium]|jgi:hypothetical protein|nr:LysM domain-containing protein [Thermoanaerobaculia bacterium]